MLPAAVLDHLTAARSSYLAHYASEVEKATTANKGRVSIEAAIAIEGELPDQRLDLVIEAPAGIERHFVVAPSTSKWEHSEHDLGTSKLLVDEIVWFALTLVVQPPVADQAFLVAWFRKWFDGAPASAGVEKPFGGHVHYFDIDKRDDGYRIDVDLGSAPVSAVDELVALCVEHGAAAVWMFSGDDALAARIPDLDDDGGMFELPDDLLEYLAATRLSYIGDYEARLAELIAEPGKIAIEAGAGRKQGELAMRVDILHVDEAEKFTPHEVQPSRALDWEDGLYALPGFDLYVMRLVWPAVMLLGTPVPKDLGFLTEWFRKWIEQGFDVDQPFHGFVHMMSEPHIADDRFTVLVDLGSAPVEALRELIERYKLAGVTSLSIGSGEVGAEGRDPAAGRDPG